jgi:NAD(P)-dependent dehydrogenase (short-subunit alcohol dehydrogenase family)
LNALAERQSQFRLTPPTPQPSRPRSKKTVATFGRLDVLVNNAGTAIPKKFEETKDANSSFGRFWHNQNFTSSSL